MLQYFQYPRTAQRYLFSSVCLAIVCVFSAQPSHAADNEFIRKRIEDLSSPDPGVRANACYRLREVVAKDEEDVVVDAVMGAMNDMSGSVRLAAVTTLGRIGPAAKKAVPDIIECYRRDTVSKASVIKTLEGIGPESAEAVDFLIEVVRGGKAGVTRPFESDNPPIALRRDAIVALGTMGPDAGKSIPVLLDVLNVAALDVSHHGTEFKTTAGALSVIGVGDKRVMSKLKQFQQGKGLPTKGKSSQSTQAVKQAILTADSAVKRLEKAEEAAAAKNRDKAEKE